MNKLSNAEVTTYIFFIIMFGIIAIICLLAGCTPTMSSHPSPNTVTLEINMDDIDNWEESDDVGRFVSARITDQFNPLESIDAPVTDVRVYDDIIVIDIEADLDGYEDIELTDIYGERHDAIVR